MMTEQQDPRLMLKQASVKDKIHPHEVIVLESNFYKIIREFLESLSGEDKETLMGIYNSLVLSRKSKITRLAETAQDDPTIYDKITDEEKDYYNSILATSKQFKDEVLLK